MRRALSLCVLLAGGWSQALAGECVMGLEREAAHAAQAGHAAHTSHAQHPAAPGPADAGTAPEPHHPDSNCRLLLPCVAGALPMSTDAQAAVTPPVLAAPAGPTAAAVSANLPPQDPPPPRLPV